MRLRECHNFHDFRRLARRRLPRPVFDYIDGAADDEVTHRRNTASFERCDLVPNVLRGVETADLSVTVLGQKLALPVYCSPTALQRLFHHEGERAVAAAAARHGTMFGVSSLGTVSIEELRKAHDTPQVYQFYFHKDRGLNRAMLQRAKGAGVEARDPKEPIAKPQQSSKPVEAPDVTMSEANAIYELWAIPLYFPTSYSLVKPYVSGFEMNSLDAPSLADVSINSDWQPK